MNLSSKNNSGMSVLLIVIFLTMGFISITQQFIQSQYKKGMINDYPVLIHSPKILKALSLNFAEIIADIVWIRCVRYIYHHQHIDNKFPYLYDFINQIVTLSPYFVDAYKLGAENLFIVACEPDKAIELLKKGIKYNPDEWILYYKLGECYYIGKKDKMNGAYYYYAASMIPGSPSFISDILTDLSNNTDDRVILYNIWKQIYNTTTMKNLKQIAKIKMLKIKKGYCPY
jgi:tetratricopeptide (TPR) repeat protein